MNSEVALVSSSAYSMFLVPFLKLQVSSFLSSTQRRKSPLIFLSIPNKNATIINNIINNVPAIDSPKEKSAIDLWRDPFPDFRAFVPYSSTLLNNI